MRGKAHSLDQQTFKKLRRLYIIALSVIALSVVISQLLVRNYIKDQKGDSTVVNVAGRQRMLSQKLTKEILLLTTVSDAEGRIALKNKIKETLELWELSHKSLQTGNVSVGLQNTNSEVVSVMFKELNPVFKTIKNGAKSIVSSLDKSPVLSVEHFKTHIEAVTKNEASFLTTMDTIVNQYNIEANDKISWLQNLELLLMLLTLLMLLGEFLFVFWPTAKSVKASLAKLLKAEKKAEKMAFEADELSFAKEQSIKELSALTKAMHDTLLYARLNANGTILEIGNKFSSLFGYHTFNPNVVFSELISSRDNEQTLMEDILLKSKTIGWQGEVKATTKKNEDVWLEMSIIPFNPVRGKSQLLIIATNSTKKKVAQLEIERLTAANFEEKMSQQKIISSKIIENQEKEQNRIAKDVHDGIGQMLTGLKYNLESIDANDIEKTASKIELLKQQASDIIKGIRTATFNLTPPELTDHGVVPAIAKLTKELAKLTGKHIELNSKVASTTRLDSLIEINIYRITQEAINNAIKYANSTHIVVTLTLTKTMISVVIDDNGKGFALDKVKYKKNGDGGMGMTFMKERINYIDGRLFLSSEINKGTRVTLNVPL